MTPYQFEVWKRKRALEMARNKKSSAYLRAASESLRQQVREAERRREGVT